MPRPVHEPVKRMPEFRGDDPVFAAAAHGGPNEPLRTMVAVAFRCVNQVDPQRLGRLHDCRDVAFRVILSPFAAILPRAKADDRNAEIRLAEEAIAHDHFFLFLSTRPATFMGSPKRRMNPRASFWS